MAPPAAAAPPASAPPSRRPVDSPFYQQRLKAWQPILTPKWAVVTFLLIGIPFVAVGFWLKSANDAVVEVSLMYDGPGAAVQCQPTPNGTTCPLVLPVTQAMKAPVYVYYALTNFYQNHRRYVKSKVDKQLAGEVITDPNSLKDCDPLVKGPGETVLQPCGLIAQSYFNGAASGVAD